MNADQLDTFENEIQGEYRLFHRDELNDPQWERASPCHDWRNHVPEILRRHWALLDMPAKLAAFVLAEHAANLEEWD